MPRFRLNMALSLDGYIASPDGTVHWLEPYDPYEVGFGEFLAKIGTIVMGRRSYEQMLGFGPWPYAGKRTIVMTRRGLAPATPDTEISDAPVAALADQLRREAGADIWVFGGAEIARAFLAARRLDTLELAIIPLVLGAGIPLFGPGTAFARLRPHLVWPYSNGIVQVHYDVSGD
jgi:dihydrofolate reductase